MTEQMEADAQLVLEFEDIVEEQQSFVYNLTYRTWGITPTPKRQPRTHFSPPIEISIASAVTPSYHLALPHSHQRGTYEAAERP